MSLDPTELESESNVIDPSAFGLIFAPDSSSVADAAGDAAIRLGLALSNASSAVMELAGSPAILSQAGVSSVLSKLGPNPPKKSLEVRDGGWNHSGWRRTPCRF